MDLNGYQSPDDVDETSSVEQPEPAPKKLTAKQLEQEKQKEENRKKLEALKLARESKRKVTKSKRLEAVKKVLPEPIPEPIPESIPEPITMEIEKPKNRPSRLKVIEDDASETSEEIVVIRKKKPKQKTKTIIYQDEEEEAPPVVQKRGRGRPRKVQEIKPVPVPKTPKVKPPTIKAKTQPKKKVVYEDDYEDDRSYYTGDDEPTEMGRREYAYLPPKKFGRSQEDAIRMLRGW
jgi:hypothetical protein